MFYYKEKERLMKNEIISECGYLPIFAKQNGIEFIFYDIESAQEWAEYIKDRLPEVSESLNKRVSYIMEKTKNDFLSIDKKIEEIKVKEEELMKKTTLELIQCYKDTNSAEIQEIVHHILNERKIYCFVNAEPKLVGSISAFNKMFGRFDDDVFKNKYVFVPIPFCYDLNEFVFIGDDENV